MSADRGPPEAPEAPASHSEGWRHLLRGPALGHVILVMLAISLHAMDVFVISTILPSLVGDIGGEAYYAWPSAIYLVFSIIGAASGGIIGAHQGLRRAPMLAASCYLVGSLICALAPEMVIFLIGRAAQGLGGGLLVALAYAMIQQLFSNALRPHMFALVSVVWGAAALIGPAIGGAFAQLGFWRGVYWLTVPIFGALSLLIWKGIRDGARQPGKLDLPWRRLLGLGIAIFLVTLSGRLDIAVLRLLLIAAAVAGVAWFLWRDQRAENRLLPSRPASLNHPVGAVYWILFLLAMTYMPISIFLPLLAQQLHGVPPSLAGFVSAAMAFGWSSFAFFTSGASVALQRILIVTGPLCILAGVIGQSLLFADGPVLALSACVFLVGAGIGQSYAHISTRAMNAAAPGEGAITSAAIPTMQSIGIAFGAATGGILANMAGLSAGISVASVTATMERIYAFSLIPAILVIVVAIRLLILTRRASAPS